MPPAAAEIPPKSTTPQQQQNPSSDSTSFSNKPSVHRSKPRLGKVRRKHVEKPNSGLNLNFFQPCSLDLNQATDQANLNNPNFNFNKGTEVNAKDAMNNPNLADHDRASKEAALNNPNLADHDRASKEAGLNNPNFVYKGGGINGNDDFWKVMSRAYVFTAENSFSDLKNPESGRNGFEFGTSETVVESPSLNVEVKQNPSFGKGKESNISSECFVSDLKIPASGSGSLNGFGFKTVAENPSLNVEMKQNPSLSNKSDKDGIFCGGGFVSGAEKGSLNMEQEESACGLSNGAVFGTSETVLENPCLDKEVKQSNLNFSNSNAGCKESDKNDASGKDLSGNFVFGAGQSCPDVKKTESVSELLHEFVFGLNVEMKESDTISNPQCRETNRDGEFGKKISGSFEYCTGKSSSDLKEEESVCGLSNGSVFGASYIGMEKPKSNAGTHIYTSFQDLNSESEELNKSDYPGNFSSWRFASAAGNSCSNFEKPESVAGFSNGFVFGASESVLKSPSLSVEMNSNSDCKDSNKNNESGNFLNEGFLFSTGKSSSNLGKAKSDRRNPHRKHSGFVSKRGVLNSNSSLIEESENLSHEIKGDAKVGCDIGDLMGSVFSGNFYDSGSTLNKTCNPSNNNVRQSVSVDSDKMKSGARGESEHTGFVFSSSLTSGPQKVSENGREAIGDTLSKVQKEKVEDGSAFGNNRKVNSFLKDHNKFDDDINKPNTEECSNNHFVNKGIHDSGSFPNNKQNFASRSSFTETFGTGVSTTDKLLDEMKRLNVDDSKEMGSHECNRDHLNNSCTSSDSAFVFGSSGKPSGCHTRQSGNTKIMDADLPGLKKTDRIDVTITNENRTRSGLGVSEEPVKPDYEFGTSEEQHPTNTTGRSSNDTSAGVSTPKLFASQAEPATRSFGFEDQVNVEPKLEKICSQSLFSSGLSDVEGFSMGRVEGNCNFSFMSTLAGVGSCATSFRTPGKDGTCSFANNVSTGLSENRECNERSRSTKNKKWKKLNRKFRKVDPVQEQPSKKNERSPQNMEQNTESPGHFSPMDFSPYRNDQSACSAHATSPGLARDEAEKRQADTSGGQKYFEDAYEEFSKKFWERFGADYPFEQAEAVGKSTSTGQNCDNNNENDGVASAVFSKISNEKQEENETRNQFCFPSSAEGNEGNIGFSSTSKEDDVSARKGRSKKKYKMKVGCRLNNIDPRSQVESSYLHLNQAQNRERSTLNSQRKVRNNSEGDEEHNTQGATSASENACEKWRIRGNKAYGKGYSSKAEEYYTKGINSFVSNESSECSIEPLLLCYSNRAAARMRCGRMREALGDCMMADSLDPSFQKVQLRAANCHLALGEIEKACQYFSKCLESKGDVCLDRRISIEAADGLQKAQKLVSCMNHCAEILRQKTSTAANSALENISSVFDTSSYSEKLLELKGEALLMLQRYKEVIQLCEESLVSAKKNFSMVPCENDSVDINASNSKDSTLMLWRWRLMSKSYFYQGKLELALELLEKLDALTSCNERSHAEELSFPSAATVRELLHHRSAGNIAFQSGRYTEAVEHYSAAVSSNIESRSFAAICFCNRAAAQQALGQLADAISDCSIAIALDASYTKAISRRATLHEKIRDYASATSDLERLISLLIEQSQDKNCGSANAASSSGTNVEELRQARRRLSSIEEKAKKELPLDHYLILGVKSTEEASEMKKAYRRAALKHHPDKAAQFLARGDSGDDGRIWKEICEEVRKDADRLFKTIGEAYAVLSDPNKRSEYDLQEELRNTRKESNRNRDSTEFYSSPFRNRNSSRYSQESWRTYGYSRSQW